MKFEYVDLRHTRDDDGEYESLFIVSIEGMSRVEAAEFADRLEQMAEQTVWLSEQAEARS